MARTTDQDPVRVEQTIAAVPVELYALISDVTNMGRWSPENHACRWVGGATGPVVGARFKGANRRGRRRWSTTSKVVVADEGRRFAFDVGFVGAPISRWTYDFEAVDGGTRVTETWEDRRPGIMRRLSPYVMGVPDQAAHNRAGMEATLAALKASVEA
jgi:hypothetical protein